MDTRTGHIYDMIPGETREQMAVRLGIPTRSLVELGNQPEETCRKCGGKGYKPRGLNSKRFKPCDCTNPKR